MLGPSNTSRGCPDGRHFENRKYAITIGRGECDLHQILHDDVEIGADLNFSQKLRKREIQDGGRPPF